MISMFVGLFDMGQQNPASSTRAGVLRTPPKTSQRFGQIAAFTTPTHVQAGTLRTGPQALFLRKI